MNERQSHPIRSAVARLFRDLSSGTAVVVVPESRCRPDLATPRLSKLTSVVFTTSLTLLSPPDSPPALLFPRSTSSLPNPTLDRRCRTRPPELEPRSVLHRWTLQPGVVTTRPMLVVAPPNNVTDENVLAHPETTRSVPDVQSSTTASALLETGLCSTPDTRTLPTGNHHRLCR